MTKERQECLELEMRVESMLIEVKEPPPIGKSRLICGYCHHRGHRNSGSQPCKMKKCTDYTYCGIKDKHTEYFSKLNSLKVELKKKKSALQEIEAQIKSMDDFTTGSEYSFVKNLTPRMFAADPSYKVNKAKLMRDVRLLRTFLDGKIPAFTANDSEQLRILISKCKKNVGISPDTDVDICDTKNTAVVCDVSPIKNEIKVKERLTERTDESEYLTQRSKKKHKRKKQKKTKKIKKRRRERSSSSSSSEDDIRSMCSSNANPGFAGAFPYFNPIHSANYNLPMHYPSNPYFYSPPYDPTLNPGHGYYTPQHGNLVSNLVDNHQQTTYAPSFTTTAKCGNNIVSSVDSQNINNNTNLHEEPAQLGSLDVRVTTTLTPPKSVENKSSNHERFWSNLKDLADAAIEQDNEKN